MSHNRNEKREFIAEAKKNGFKELSDGSGRMQRGNDRVHWTESGNSPIVNGSVKSTLHESKKSVH